MNQTTQQSQKMDHQKIWWLASYPKSGNTWMRMLLEYYTSGTVDINTRYGHFVKGDLRRQDFQAVTCIPLTRMTTSITAYLRPAQLLSIISHANGADVCLKTHHTPGAMHGIDLIPAPMTKGAVYVVRDPRDVAISWSHHGSVSIDTAIDQMTDPLFSLSRDNVLFHWLGRWDEHVDRWAGGTAPFRVTAVRFEDLLINGERQFKRAIEGLKMELKFKRVREAVKACAFQKLRAQEDKDGFVEKKGGSHFFRKGTAGQWKHAMSAEQVARIESEFGATMRKFGYLDNGETNGSGTVVNKEDCVDSQLPEVGEHVDSVPAG